MCDHDQSLITDKNVLTSHKYFEYPYFLYLSGIIFLPFAWLLFLMQNHNDYAMFLDYVAFIPW